MNTLTFALASVFLFTTALVLEQHAGFFVKTQGSETIYLCDEFHPAPTARTLAAPQGQLDAAEVFRFLIGD